MEIAAAEFANSVALNLISGFLDAKHQIPLMLDRGGGSVIFTATFVVHTIGFPGVAAYAVGKSGLIGLTQALAAEFGLCNVRVNSLLPGAVDTPLYREMNGSDETQAFITGLHALKRVAASEELVRSALYLAFASSFTTGTAMMVDGGASITRT